MKNLIILTYDGVNPRKRVIDTNNNNVLKRDFKEISEYEFDGQTFYIVEDQFGNKGLFEQNGTPLLECKQQDIRPISTHYPHLLTVKKNDFYSIYDLRHGKWFKDIDYCANGISVNGKIATLRFEKKCLFGLWKRSVPRTIKLSD
jgi:hypothetical protein